jgi:ribosomal protein S18 acetylase RimI-like enzyme
VSDASLRAPARHVLRRSPFSRRELEQFAELHHSEIPTGFLSSLGVLSLRALYEALGDSAACVVVAGVRAGDDVVDGFICGSLDSQGLYRELLRWRRRRLLGAMARRLVSWQRVLRAAETLWYPRRRSLRALPAAEILNFVVRPEARGRGLAERLFDALMAEMHARGVTRIRIVTGAAQRRAQGFYEKRGALRVGRVDVHRGTESYVYVYDVAGEGRAGPDGRR